MSCDFCGYEFKADEATITIGNLTVCKMHDAEPSDSKQSWAMSNPEPEVLAWAAGR